MSDWVREHPFLWSLFAGLFLGFIALGNLRDLRGAAAAAVAAGVLNLVLWSRGGLGWRWLDRSAAARAAQEGSDRPT